MREVGSNDLYALGGEEEGARGGWCAGYGADFVGFGSVWGVLVVGEWEDRCVREGKGMVN